MHFESYLLCFSQSIIVLKSNCYYFIFLFLASPLSGLSQWLCPWENRQEINVQESSGNDLTDYQIKLEIPFTTGMNADYSDLRFTGADGTSLLFHYVETFDATRAIVWLKIPSLPANDLLDVFLYYCNPSATSTSNPDSTFLFFDDFDTFSGWQNFGSGAVTQNNTTFPGISTLQKINNCDPNGGYKFLGQTISSFRLITREIRENTGAGCALNRYGLEGNGFNGYTLRRRAVTNSTGNFGFERRNNGNANNAQTTNISQPYNAWLRTELTRCEDGILESIGYDDNKTEVGSISGVDNTYDTFDKITVRGGLPYFFDFIAVAKFVCREPTVNFSEITNDEPIAVCQDITIALDSNGKYLLGPELLDGGSTDCNDLIFTASDVAFECDRIGTHTLTLTVMDPHGLSDQCQANLTVVDTLPPIVNCPNDIVIPANDNNCTAIVSWSAPEVSENCQIVSFNSNFQSGDIFQLGTTTVTYDYIDQSGNTGTCSFSIEVISNATPPIISIAETSGNTTNDGVICQGDIVCLNPTPGYFNYNWSDGSTDEQLCTSAEGSYAVTAENIFGCPATSDSISIQTLEKPSAGTCLLNNDYCQIDEGQVQIQVSNGTPPYIVNWVPSINAVSSGIISSNGASLTVDNIPGGTIIDFSIIDDNGCQLD